MEINPVEIADKMLSEARELEKSDKALHDASLSLIEAERVYNREYAKAQLKLRAGEPATIDDVTCDKLPVAMIGDTAKVMCEKEWLAYQLAEAEVVRIKKKTDRLDKVLSILQSINRNLSHIVE